MLHKYKTNSKRTWQVMEEITGKKKQNQFFSSKKLMLIKQLYKIHKTLLKNSTNLLFLLDQNWQKKSPTLKKMSRPFVIS